MNDKVIEFPADHMHRIPVNLPSGPGAPWTAAQIAALKTAEKVFAEYHPYFQDRLITEGELVYRVVSAYWDEMFPVTNS